MVRKQIPNCITLANLLCGVLSVYYLFEGMAPLAALLIVTGAIFDFFDGFAARLLGVSSPIGKELDSLADVVTFGLAPSLIMVKSLETTLSETLSAKAISLLPLFMVLMSAYRLAKFNTDERQTTSFIGLPTPANAMLWLSVPLIDRLALSKTHLWGFYDERIYSAIANFLTNPWFICIGSVIMGILLVSELPMFSLKFKNFSWHDNKIKFSFLLISIVLLFVLNCFAIPFIILTYIAISIITNIVKK